MRTLLLFGLLALPLAACASDEGADDSTLTTDPGDGNDEGANESGGGEDLVLSDDACETDADCVPAECCHAAACVAQANAPACEDAMCTMDCRYGTLDCGGRCLCHDGRCAARLSEQPQLQPAPQ